MLVLLLIVLLGYGLFVLDAYLVTKSPKRRHIWQRPTKEEEDDLLYTPVHQWVADAREEVKK